MSGLIEFGDCREIMRSWPGRGIKARMCVTSPPYYGLRDYGTARWEGGDTKCDHLKPAPKLRTDIPRGKLQGGLTYVDEAQHLLSYRSVCKKCGARRVDDQIGLESTPEGYISGLVNVFRCVRDVLTDDGTLWINIGDSYAGSGKASKDGAAGSAAGVIENKALPDGCKAKDLMGIPWMLAFALRADGWFLRADIIWHKPNPMPESVTDRCTRSHEYLFMLAKSRNYFYNAKAIAEDSVTAVWNSARSIGIGKSKATQYGGVNRPDVDRSDRNKRTVWTVPTRPYKGAHFAAYPIALIKPCILAGSERGDSVLDPFMGSGTTAQAALTYGRKYLGCELNEKYKPLHDRRIARGTRAAGFGLLG